MGAIRYGEWGMWCLGGVNGLGGGQIPPEGGPGAGGIQAAGCQGWISHVGRPGVLP